MAAAEQFPPGKHHGAGGKMTLMKSLIVSCTLLLLMVWQDVSAQSINESPVPTTLEDVLTSVQQHYPLIKAAQADINSRDAMVRAAEGAFDPVLAGSYRNRLSGYYDGAGLETFYEKRFPTFGAKLFAGVRHSSGDFPVYESQYAADPDGETRIGLSMSLWRDRDIDEYRYQTATSRLDATSERYALLGDVIGILEQAYIAYAQWLQAAKLLDDYSGLLEIATDRADAVRRSVENGDAAEIVAVDNDLAVLQRRSLVVDAQRLLDASAHKLSLFFRRSDGSPGVPFYRETLSMPADSPAAESDPEIILNRVIARDPAIAQAKLAREKLALDEDLAENQARPKVDLRVYNTRQLGNGFNALQGSENVADISFSIPLATNTARGKASAARARMASVDHRIRQMINQARTELDVARVNLRATAELANIALLELEASLRLAEAEARRFEAGLSDFFQLNQREQVVAEAELKRWRAHFEHQVALANYYAVSLDMDALGLDQTLFTLPAE
jgi:cobalt-zinc-cadmium efflux system outer membrane protein